MKIGIVGASASGLYTALLLSRRKRDAEITLFDRMDKAGKKILATGNGHCNLFHVPFLSGAFNHPEFVDLLLKSHNEEELLIILDSLGIATMAKGELIYPLSYSAGAFLSYLLRLCEKEGIRFRLDETVTGVRGGKVKTDLGQYEFDKVVFAFGGKSQENLGSDGSMFPVLEQAGYRIQPLRPSLCPIKSGGVAKSLFGVRHGAKVNLLRKGQILYAETGEILFKKDGLSGIAIMNISSFAKKGDEIVLDLFPELSEAALSERIRLAHKAVEEGFLGAILEKPFADFVNKKLGICGDKKIKEAEVAHFLKNMSFPVDGFYDFDSSQVTKGGIQLDQVDENLKSKMDDHHYFVGECLDIDGLCGGYNLGFALLSALTVAEAL